MTRLLSLVVVLCLLVTLASCGAELTPIEKCQQKVVSIGEAYLNYDITSAEAIEQLDSLRVPETEGHGQLSLEVDIAALSFAIRTEASYASIERKIDSIRKYTYE